MVSGIIIRITAAGGFASNPPGSLAACMAPIENIDPPRSLFVFENGEGRELTWQEFHAAGVVVGFAEWIHGVLTAEAVAHMSPEILRDAMRHTFAQDWPISPRRTFLS